MAPWVTTPDRSSLPERHGLETRILGRDHDRDDPDRSPVLLVVNAGGGARTFRGSADGATFGLSPPARAAATLTREAPDARRPSRPLPSGIDP